MKPPENQHPSVVVAARRRSRHPIFTAVDCGALDDVPAAIACFSGMELVHANVEWCNLIGLDHQRCVGYGWLDAFGRLDRDAALSILGPENPTDDTEVDLRLDTGDGSEVWLRVRSRLLGEDVLPVQRVTSMTMIGARPTRDIDVLRLATHDELTGLRSRSSFVEGVTEVLAESTGLTAMLLIDLDRFTDVNDRLGHRGGDELLQAVGRRLELSTRPGDLIARLGGDRFGAFYPSLGSATEAARLAERMIRTVRQPFSLEGETVTIGASIGVGVATGPQRSAESLLDEADQVLSLAKAGGGGCFSMSCDMTAPTPQSDALIGSADAEPRFGGSLEARARQFKDLVGSGIVVAQAEGILAQRTGADLCDSAAALREYASANGVDVRTAAQLIVARQASSVHGNQPGARGRDRKVAP